MKRYFSKTARMLTLIVWVLVISLNVAAQQSRKGATARKSQRRVPTARFASGKSALSIPLEIDNSIILVRVRVNNSKPLKFNFDTGASLSVINSERAAELGLKPEGKAIGNATGGVIQGSFVRGVSLSVQGAEVSNQLAGIFSFGAVSCFEMDGVIGYDFIKQFVVELDYQNKTLNLYDPRTYTYNGKGEVIPISLAGRTPTVRTKIFLEGREAVEGQLEVDTGADSTLVINSPFVAKQRLLAALTKTLQGSTVGAGGEQELIMGRIKAVQLGRFVFDNPIIGLSRDTEGSGASEKNDGLIGGEILRRFKVILDYSRNRMILEPNSNFSDPYENDMSGFAVASDEADCKAMKVESVMENSPAAEAGLQPGDIITAIDGKPTDSFASDELEKLFRQHGKELTLTVKRGEGVIQTKLKLRRLV
jgi:predicted aspartyl protease